jgi:hypothetical protein
VRGKADIKAAVAEIRFFERISRISITNSFNAYLRRVFNQLFNALSVRPEQGQWLDRRIFINGWHFRARKSLPLIDQLVPDDYFNFAACAFWYYIPVHVSITFFGNPNDVAETWTSSNHNIDLDGTSLCNEEVGSDL